MLLEYLFLLFSYSIRSLLLVNFFMTGQSGTEVSDGERKKWNGEGATHTEGETATAGLGFFILYDFSARKRERIVSKDAFGIGTRGARRQTFYNGGGRTRNTERQIIVFLSVRFELRSVLGFQ
jgi:hypothetical protein